MSPSTLAAQIIAKAVASGLWLATAESCTGGMVAAALTDIAGASAAFERGLVTYSNAAKIALLGVEAGLIETYGAVSRQCAEAMAAGLLARAPVDLAVSVTGIAGPGGGSAEKPVGTVWFGVASAAGVRSVGAAFGPLSRADIRALATGRALDLLDGALDALPAKSGA